MSVRFLIVCGGSGVNLLGQRQVLGVDAELQIDASKENVVRQWESQDPRSHVLELDQNVGTTGLLFKETLSWISEDVQTFDGDEGSSEYVQRGLYQEQDIEHARFLVKHSVANVALERGLAQSPAIGGLAIRHPENRLALEQVFGRMTDGRGLGPENPLEAWIVSSTAGGTGEGVHRFVAACLADFVRRRYTDTPLTVNFVRVGQLTYQTVNMQRTAMNTFFGVAADAGFALKASDEFPELATHWFYVDVPDVGTGARSVPVRAQIVEMAAKAVMLEELQDDLQRLLVNNGGIPMVLTRTGYWGRDFGEKRKYYETLRQLREKLRELVEPDYERKYIGGDDRQAPRLESGEELQEWTREASDREYVLRRMEEDWQFPRYRMRGYPGSLGEVREEVTEWKTALSELLRQDLEGLRADWMVDRVRKEGGEVRRETVPLRVSTAGDVEFGRQEWFQRIEEAHEALAWSWALLGCDLRQGTPRRGGRWNRIEELLERAREISRALHGFNPFQGSEAKARRAARELGRFLKTLLEVDLLLRLEQEAWRVLEAELNDARQVLETTESEFQVISRAVGRSVTEVVRAADLSSPLDPATQDTWLQLLGNAARRGDRGRFENQVLRGATGLTKAGLLDVLGLRPQADVAEIHDELAANMGRMYDPDGNEYEAPWWAATDAGSRSTMRYEYRILPWLEPVPQASLEAYADQRETQYRYIFTEMGTIGLYVLAFSGISLTQRPGDTKSMPAFLMKPFVPVVRDALDRWVAEPRRNETSGQLQIVLAGVGGEPLHVEAARKAGLEEDEIEKINQFYKLYRGEEEEVEAGE